MTAPTNGLLNTMWKRVTMKINGEVVNSASDEHHLRSYFYFCLNNTGEQKVSCLNTAGYHYDSGVIIGTKSAPGFDLRRIMFRNKDNTDYSGVEVPFVGPLFSDFKTATNGCAPRTKINFTFHRNKQEFLIESYDG